MADVSGVSNVAIIFLVEDELVVRVLIQNGPDIQCSGWGLAARLPCFSSFVVVEDGFDRGIKALESNPARSELGRSTIQVSIN